MSDINNSGPNDTGSSESGKAAGKPVSVGHSVEEYRLVPVDDYHFEDDKVIDVIGILKDLWVNKKTILGVACIVLLAGIFIYAASERIYYSETQLMPETSGQQSSLGQIFQQYENLLGFSQMVEEDDISVAMYPYIVESLPFQMQLMQEEVYFGDMGGSLTLFEYFSEHHQKSFLNRTAEFLWDYTIGLPFTLLNFVRSFSSAEQEMPPVDFAEMQNFEEPKVIDPRIRRVSSEITSLIAVTRDPQTGFVSIGVSMPDPRASAETVNLVRRQLQEYVTEYRTEKAIEDLVFIESQYEEAKTNFEASQDTLASFQDSNVNLATARAEAIEERLIAEFNLRFEMYNSLARRLQEAKIQVQEETPVFRVHEPVTVTQTPAEPNALRIFAGALFAGLFLGVAFLYFRRGYRKFRAEFDKKDPQLYKI